MLLALLLALGVVSVDGTCTLTMYGCGGTIVLVCIPQVTVLIVISSVSILTVINAAQPAAVVLEPQQQHLNLLNIFRKEGGSDPGLLRLLFVDLLLA